MSTYGYGICFINIYDIIFSMKFQIPQNEISRLVLINGVIGVVLSLTVSILAGIISDKIKKQKSILIIITLITEVGLVLLVFTKFVGIVILGCTIINIDLEHI